MVFNQDKRSCYNCKGKHCFDEPCPWSFCVFCWQQLDPAGAFHCCPRNWVTALPYFGSQGEYRAAFKRRINKGESWNQLYEFYMQMREEYGHLNNAVQNPEVADLLFVPEVALDLAASENVAATNSSHVPDAVDFTDAAAPSSTPQDPVAPSINNTSGGRPIPLPRRVFFNVPSIAANTSTASSSSTRRTRFTGPAADEKLRRQREEAKSPLQKI